jgi:hypothetical protein
MKENAQKVCFVWSDRRRKKRRLAVLEQPVPVFELFLYLIILTPIQIWEYTKSHVILYDKFVELGPCPIVTLPLTWKSMIPWSSKGLTSLKGNQNHESIDKKGMQNRI